MRSQTEIEQAIEFECGVIAEAEEDGDGLLEAVSRGRLDVLEWVDRGDDMSLLVLTVMLIAGAIGASIFWGIAWAVIR